MKNLNIKLFILLFTISLSGCKKFLEEKPDQTLSTIETIADMQALLDNFGELNYKDISLGEACSDNYFLSEANFNARTEIERNLYTWAPANVLAPTLNAWREAYSCINITNNVLAAAIQKESRIDDKAKLANIRAQALFFRAKSFLNLIGIWAMPYEASTAGTLPGIPLRLDPNFNTSSTRATIAAGYTQIIADLKTSLIALPAKDIIQTRPSKAAAYGMLSRTYLQMRNYIEAEKYADSCLQINSNLLDFNTLSTTANFPISILNAEVSYEGRMTTHSLIVQTRAFINPELYAKYANNDLRKSIFFKASGSNYIFKGSYEGSANYFSGIATDEMYLNRAECRIRAGQVDQGLNDLNLLLSKRYKTGTFIPYTALSQTQALALIKTERQKELLFRGLRWQDIRRFNLEGDQIVQQRIENGITYMLMPNSLLYALAIPEDIIRLSGMQQNER